MLSPPAERLWTGARWAEGPVWFAEQSCLVFSDVRSNRMLRWEEATGEVSVFREPSHFANGNTRDGQGRLVTCEHGTRSVVRTEPDGSRTVLADAFEGRRLNSPNDVVVRSDGAIYFSDPTYGIDSDAEGYEAESEIGACGVYRIDPRTGACELAAGGFVQPNGLAFSPGEERLYVSDTGVSHVEDGPRHLRVFDVDGPVLRGGSVLAECPDGVFDGLRVDPAGRIWTSAGDGVHCLAPDGAPLGRIPIPETVANVELGGADGTALFICASTSLYRAELP